MILPLELEDVGRKQRALVRALTYVTLYRKAEFKYICKPKAMPMTMVSDKSKTSVPVAEVEPGHDEYHHRCISTTESFVILRSLMYTFILIGNMGWKDFSKSGWRVHLTKSTVYGIVVIMFLSTNVIRWCLAINNDETFGVILISKLIAVAWGLETLSHCIGFFITSLSHKRLPEFLFEWDKLRSQCVQNTATLKKQTNIWGAFQKDLWALKSKSS